MFKAPEGQTGSSGRWELPVMLMLGLVGFIIGLFAGTSVNQ